jgi:hypothetical protein
MGVTAGVLDGTLTIIVMQAHIRPRLNQRTHAQKVAVACGQVQRCPNARHSHVRLGTRPQ